MTKGKGPPPQAEDPFSSPMPARPIDTELREFMNIGGPLLDCPAEGRSSEEDPDHPIPSGDAPALPVGQDTAGSPLCTWPTPAMALAVSSLGRIAVRR